MSKLKLGDTVIRISEFNENSGEYFSYINPKAFRINLITTTGAIQDPEGKFHSPSNLRIFNLIKSPVQEVMSKKLVSGTYGPTKIDIKHDQPANLKIAFLKYVVLTKPTIDDMRQLAFVATELANFMEENKDAYQYN